MPATERDVWQWLRPEPDLTYDGQFFAIIEKVHSMPKQGVASSFKFGQSYGFLRGCLVASGIPFEEVSPQVWQKELGCLSKGDKNVTKARAQSLFPQLRITHATADALLICEYARRLWSRRNGTK
jgi:crossover junction endodeoxyribonuclease RuvC